LRDFFSDEAVQEHFRVLAKGREWVAPRGSLEAVEVEVVPTTLTSMTFFDRLEEADPPVVRSNGDLVKCFDNFIDGVQISDLLRDLLLNEESEHAELFAEEEGAGLLSRIFFPLARGGGCPSSRTMSGRTWSAQRGATSSFSRSTKIRSSKTGSKWPPRCTP